MNKLVIIGAGGHGKVIADIALKNAKYDNVCFLDDNNASSCLGLPVVGKIKDFEKFIDSSEIFVAIGDNQKRSQLIEELLEKNAKIPVLIHSDAVVGSQVELGDGTAIMAGAVVNPCTKIGKGVILNTCSSIDHDCFVGDYSHIAVGVHVAGSVNLGKSVCLGAGVTVKNNVNICADCFIGAGAVVIEDLKTPGTYVGVPAKLLK